MPDRRIRGRASKRRGEGGALGGGAAGGEQLLELVDRQEEAFARGSVEGLGERTSLPTRARGEAPPAAARRDAAAGAASFRCRQDPVGEREQTGAEDGGLSAARRADDAEESCADQAGDELGDEPLAAEEVVAIDWLEACEALERACPLGGRAGGGGEGWACSRASWTSITLPVSSASTRSDVPAGGGAGGGVHELPARLVDGDRELPRARARQLG